MTRIHSKPSKFIENDWRQVEFHVDIEGLLSDSNVKRAVS
jgi:prephenate dehydratase